MMKLRAVLQTVLEGFAAFLGLGLRVLCVCVCVCVGLVLSKIHRFMSLGSLRSALAA